MLLQYQSRLLPPLSISVDLPLASLGLGQKGPKSPASRRARRTERRRILSNRNSTSRCPPLCYLLVPPNGTSKPTR